MPDTDTNPFVWNGIPLITIGELGDAICAIDTREEAHHFMAAYRASTPHAAANIGYLAGYYDQETAQRIYAWFETAHPIFGTQVPPPDEAVLAGQQMMEGSR